ncbi:MULTISPECIES: hypothetical protein [unclassified Agrococcus]|uniref:hypothetical protein n=1 Tax=unclassified Agrococcus TaxID=2615065 RepID=UPI003612A819
MTDYMKTQTTITASDLEHLRDEAERVHHALWGSTASHRDVGPRVTASRVYGVSNCTAQLLRTVGDQEAWQQLLGDEALDRLLQALRVTLEQVDPAWKAAA